MTKYQFFLYVTILAGSLSPFNAQGRPVVGTASIHLAGPLNKDITDKAYAVASGYFKTDCIEWLREEIGTTVDTLNAIWNYHLSSFTDNCLRLAKQESYFKGRDWSLTLTLSSEDAQAVLKEYNSRCQALSLQTWTQLKKLLDGAIDQGVFQLGIQAIFYSMGRIEKSLDVPGVEEPGAFLVDDARKIMQNYLERISIRSKNFIISGKPGANLEQPLVLEVLRDTTPVPDFNLYGALAHGKKLFSGKTGPNGILTLQQFKIPIVPKGAFLYIMPDFGAAVNFVCSFSASDLGIKSPEQTVLFNTVAPLFLATYKAQSAGALQIPKDFAEDRYLRKYLRDSCFLQPASGADKADLFFTVTNQVTCYSNDSTEETVYKVESAVTIADSSGSAIAKKTALILEKAYETNSNYSPALFFWEATGKSFHMIKEMLGNL